MSVGKRRLLRSVATKSVVALLPIAMVSGYAGALLVPTPPRLAAYDYQPVAEITVQGSTVGLADSSLYFLTDPTLTIDPAQVAKHLDEMQALGVDNIRVYVPWRYVESTQGQYDWSSMDVIMAKAAERNMGVLAAINTTPAWAEPENPAYPGAGQPDADDFEDFVSAFATKYGSSVSAYEIWNEPNYIQFYDPVDPAAYTELLKTIYPTLKAIDPTATIVAAGLGHSQGSGNVAMSPVEFVRGMYEAGAKGYFDALAYHPYQETTPFSQGTPDGYALNQAQAMVALMASNGDYIIGPGGQPLVDVDGNPVTKKIWATEYGLPTSRVSYEHQADYIQDFLATWSMQSWAGPAYVYTTVDSNPGSDDAEGNYGVYTIDADGNWVKKPAAEVLAAWILAHPNQTFDPPVPTGPKTPTDPFQVFAALLQQFVQQFVAALSQSFVGAIVTAITNWLGSFAGPAITNPTPSTLRVASIQPSDTVALADPPATPTGEPSASKVDGHVAKAADPATATAAPVDLAPAESTRAAVVTEPKNPDPVPVSTVPEAAESVPATSDAPSVTGTAAPTHTTGDANDSTGPADASTDTSTAKPNESRTDEKSSAGQERKTKHDNTASSTDGTPKPAPSSQASTGADAAGASSDRNGSDG